MKDLPIATAVLLIALTGLCFAEDHVPGEILVKWKEGVSEPAIHAVKRSLNMRAERTFPSLGVHHVKLSAGMTVEQALAHLKQHPSVAYAEPNYIVRALAVPNDPRFNQLWGLHNTGQTGGSPDADVDAPEAWDIHTGSPDVVIAVLDTGVAYNHPDLDNGAGRNIWANSAELNGIPGVDDDGNGYVDDVHGWDFLGDDNDPMDYHGHGTHVAGTIAAIGSNGTGITGLNWYASIMPLRFLGPFGSGDTAKAIEAILYAADNGAQVINASWGGGGFSQALYDAISYANNEGCLFVAAAGNSGNNNDTNPFYPASYGLPYIISVAATDHNDTLASFSNYGATSVDVAAPGVHILSCVPLIVADPTVQTLLSEDFDSGLAHWTSWGTNNRWGISNTYWTSSPNSLSDSPSGDYSNNTDSFITYNTPLNLVDKLVWMDIRLRCDLEPFWDFLAVGGDVGAGNGFLPVYLLNWDGWFSGSTYGAFEQYTTDLSPLGDLSHSINIGFNLYADSSNTDDGVYIDDVVVEAQDLLIDGYDYEFFNGTSMAAPHVSGLAGLILARYPTITLQQLRDRIFQGVDVRPNLQGKVATGGRINAYKALTPLDLLLTWSSAQIRGPNRYGEYTVRGTLAIENRASQTSLPGTLRVFASPDANLDVTDSLVAEVSVPPIPGGAVLPKRLRGKADLPTDSQFLYFIAVVDSSGETTTPAELMLSGGVDLMGVSLDQSKSGPDRRGQYRVRVTFSITNTGAIPSGRCAFQVYHSPDATLDPADVPLLETPKRIPRLLPGGTKTRAFRCTLEQDPAGSYLIIKLDSEATILEMEEGNNEMAVFCQ